MSGCPGWQSVNPLCRVGQVVGSVGKSVGNDVFSAIAQYFADVANGAVSWLWDQLDSATSIDLTSPNIQGDLLATGAIAALVTFTLFLIQLIASALRQDPGGLGRGVRGLGVSFIGAAFAIAATQILLAAVDSLCDGVVQFALGTDTRGMGSKLIVASTLSSIGNPAGLLLISLVLIAAVVVVWVALMIRKMLVIVSAVFAPIAFSGASSDISRSWVRRWIEFTLALVFSKLILVIIFMIGLSVLRGTGGGSGSGSGTTNSITNLVIGALTLLLAGFAPWIAIKMVHFAGDTFQTVHHHAGSAAAGARTAAAAPQKVAVFAPTRSGGSRADATGTSPQAISQAKSRPPGSSGPPPGGGGGGHPAGTVALATAGAAAGAVRRAADGADQAALASRPGHAAPMNSNGSERNHG